MQVHPREFSLEGFPFYFSVAIYCFEGAGMILSLEESLAAEVTELILNNYISIYTTKLHSLITLLKRQKEKWLSIMSPTGRWLPSALLPRWSPLGDFGPHGDQNEFFGPLLVPFFFKVPIFSIFGLKVTKSNANHWSNDAMVTIHRSGLSDKMAWVFK